MRIVKFAFRIPIFAIVARCLLSAGYGFQVRQFLFYVRQSPLEQFKVAPFVAPLDLSHYPGSLQQQPFLLLSPCDLGCR